MKSIPTIIPILWVVEVGWLLWRGVGWCRGAKARWHGCGSVQVYQHPAEWLRGKGWHVRGQRVRNYGLQ